MNYWGGIGGGGKGYVGPLPSQIIGGPGPSCPPSLPTPMTDSNRVCCSYSFHVFLASERSHLSPLFRYLSILHHRLFIFRSLCMSSFLKIELCFSRYWVGGVCDLCCTFITGLKRLKSTESAVCLSLLPKYLFSELLKKTHNYTEKIRQLDSLRSTSLQRIETGVV